MCLFLVPRLSCLCHVLRSIMYWSMVPLAALYWNWVTLRGFVYVCRYDLPICGQSAAHMPVEQSNNQFFLERKLSLCQRSVGFKNCSGFTLGCLDELFFGICMVSTSDVRRDTWKLTRILVALCRGISQKRDILEASLRVELWVKIVAWCSLVNFYYSSWFVLEECSVVLYYRGN